jgi:lipopolysaccharide/colanic/teichoic acid biosynthesis glycosyltransferase
MDVVSALLLLLLTAPLFPLLALLVRLTPGPVIYSQVRVGENGREFTIYKFRTMRPNTEAPTEAVWATRDDPRATGPGRLMRRMRLDELPQIWNVLKGDMSLVGPRPERPELVDELVESVPFWTRRLLVKPGITGWAQVKRGYAGDTEGSADKLGYDLWYIRHRSLTVDLAICLRTIATVLRAEAHRFSATKSILLEGKSARPRERGLEVVSAAQAGSLGDSA